jgi:hypothetical protein
MSGLINGATYTFKVVATNVNGSGPVSGSSANVTPATVPGVPTSVQASLGTDGQPVLAWVASLANQMNIDLTVAVQRYASGCPRCTAMPCACR